MLSAWALQREALFLEGAGHGPARPSELRERAVPCPGGNGVRGAGMEGWREVSRMEGLGNLGSWVFQASPSQCCRTSARYFSQTANDSVPGLGGAVRAVRSAGCSSGLEPGAIHHNLQKFHSFDSLVLNRPSGLGASGMTLLVDWGRGARGGALRPGRSQDLARGGQQRGCPGEAPPRGALAAVSCTLSLGLGRDRQRVGGTWGWAWSSH